MAYLREGIVLLLSFCFHFIHSSPSSVPLITWSDSKTAKEAPSIVAGQTKDLSKAFQNYAEPLIKNKPLSLVFLQDELSSDDFTKYPSSFPHLQKVFESKQYTLLPSVSKGESGIDKLIRRVASDVEYVDSGSVNDWSYKGGNAKVVIFHLEPVRGATAAGKADILKSNDLAMHRIIKSIGVKVNDFGVVYSAEDPSQLIANILLEENMDDNGLTSRHLLADTTPTPAPKKIQTIFHNECVLMSLKSFKHVMNLENGTAATTEFIGDDDWSTKGCGSSDVFSTISLERKGPVGNYSKASLCIMFKSNMKPGTWGCNSTVFNYEYNKKAFTETYSCGNSENASMIMSPVYDTIEAPANMSFACHKVTLNFKQEKKNGTDKKTVKNYLILGRLQVQIGCNKDAKKPSPKTQFSAAFHCVGFFTIEIWTGIIVTIILMLGLYVGVMMIMAIQVQDRLDDPKGKTISVATAGNE